MRFLHIGRATWLLPLLVLTTPMLLPLEGRDHSKVPKVPSVEEQPESPEMAGIINRIIASENLYNVKLMEFSPRVETYVQYFQPDSELGDVAKNDAIFLGRLQFGKNEKEVSFLPGPTSSTPISSSLDWFRQRPAMLRTQLHLEDFALESLTVDEQNFDRQHYTFEPVRWEYLGDVRCLAIDVLPREPAGMGAFKGRIWVEDHDYAIVRMNGTRVHPPRLASMSTSIAGARISNPGCGCPTTFTARIRVWHALPLQVGDAALGLRPHGPPPAAGVDQYSGGCPGAHSRPQRTYGGHVPCGEPATVEY